MIELAVADTTEEGIELGVGEPQYRPRASGFGVPDLDHSGVPANLDAAAAVSGRPGGLDPWGGCHDAISPIGVD
jgi:hypothetical protein